MKPLWKPLPAVKTVNIPINNGGINTSSRKYPSLTTAFGRLMDRAFISVNEPIRLFVNAGGREGVLHRSVNNPDVIRIVDVEKNVTSGDVECVGEIGFAELYINTYESKAMVFASTTGHLRAVFSDNNHMSVTGQPPCNFLAVVNNRLVTALATDTAVNIYGEGEFDWEMYPTETFRIDGGKNECKGLAAFKDYLVYFSEHAMFKVSWKSDGSHTVEAISKDVGCRTSYSIVQLNGKLMWLDWHGVYEWSGTGAPKLISRKIDYLIDDMYQNKVTTVGQAVGCGGLYYLTVPKKEGTPYVLIYDTAHEIWHRNVYPERMVSLTVQDGCVLAMTDANATYSINEPEHNGVVNWEWETEIDPNTTRLKLKLKKEDKTQVQLYLIFKDGSQVELNLQSSIGEYIIPPEIAIKPTPVTLKISGSGEFELAGVEAMVRVR